MALQKKKASRINSSLSVSLSQQMLLQSEHHSADADQTRRRKTKGVCRDVRKVLGAGKKSSLKMFLECEDIKPEQVQLLQHHKPKFKQINQTKHGTGLQ